MILVRGQAFSVVEHPSNIPIHKITDCSGEVEEGVDLFLRDLIASDRSRATIKTYAFVLCAWLNFLGSRAKSWQSASLEELRDYILLLRAADNPYRSRRRSSSPIPCSINARTGKPYLASGYKPSTINHRLSVIQSFYAFQRKFTRSNAFDEMLNEGRGNAHHNPLEPWPRRRRGLYRQRQPKRVPRAIPDQHGRRSSTVSNTTVIARSSVYLFYPVAVPRNTCRLTARCVRTALTSAAPISVGCRLP